MYLWVEMGLYLYTSIFIFSYYVRAFIYTLLDIFLEHFLEDLLL